MPETVSYVIRDCDLALWKRFRAKAKRDGRSIKWLLLDMIRRYVEA